MQKTELKTFEVVYEDEASNRQYVTQIDAPSKYAAKKKFNHDHWGNVEYKIITIKEV